MSHLIQALESRMLLTATAASLGAELANVNTSSAVVKADMKALTTGAKADLLLVGKSLKGSPKTNAALLRRLQADEGKLLARMGADVTALLKASTTAKASAADGDRAISAPTNVALSAKIGADTTALLSVATKPQNKLITDSATGTVDADFGALVAANPTLTTAVGAATTAKAHFESLVAKVLTDAGKYANAISALKVDLTTLLPVPTTTPSLVGDYVGSFKTKAILFGLGSLTVPFEILITHQTLTSVTGSITAEGNTASGTIITTELSNGKVTLKISDTDLTVNLVGIVNVNTTKGGLPPGSVITGSGSVAVLGFNVSGNFVVTKVT